jgi:hypothetical protein
MTLEQLLTKLNRNFEKPNGTTIYHISSDIIKSLHQLVKEEPDKVAKLLEVILSIRGNQK